MFAAVIRGEVSDSENNRGAFRRQTTTSRSQGRAAGSSSTLSLYVSSGLQENMESRVSEARAAHFWACLFSMEWRATSSARSPSA